MAYYIYEVALPRQTPSAFDTRLADRNIADLNVLLSIDTGSLCISVIATCDEFYDLLKKCHQELPPQQLQQVRVFKLSWSSITEERSIHESYTALIKLFLLKQNEHYSGFEPFYRIYRDL